MSVLTRQEHGGSDNEIAVLPANDLGYQPHSDAVYLVTSHYSTAV